MQTQRSLLFSQKFFSLRRFLSDGRKRAAITLNKRFDARFDASEHQTRKMRSSSFTGTRFNPKGNKTRKKGKLDEMKFSAKFNLNKIRLLVIKRVLSVVKAFSTVNKDMTYGKSSRNCSSFAWINLTG